MSQERENGLQYNKQTEEFRMKKRGDFILSDLSGLQGAGGG